MSAQTWEGQSTEPDERISIIKFVGGTAAITKVFGRGVTPTYISTGLVDLIWAENPGIYLGVAGWGFEATTQADLKGFTVVAGVFNTTTRTLRIAITNASESLTDLAALQHLSIRIAFKETNA